MLKGAGYGTLYSNHQEKIRDTRNLANRCSHGGVLLGLLLVTSSRSLGRLASDVNLRHDLGLSISVMPSI